MVPKSNAPFAGSSWMLVPGSRNPLGTTVPGIYGPMMFRTDGSARLSIAHANASRSRRRARENDSGLLTS